jgi:uncharacterized membrane protein YhaH (DUF805 family)
LGKPYYGAPLHLSFMRFWKKYVTFTGRASRSEFWWWTLIWVAVSALLGTSALGGGAQGVFAGILRYAWLAATIVPFVALTWRRLHDSNLSGWWSLPFFLATVYLNLAAAVGGEVLKPNAQAMAPGIVVGNLLSAAVGIYFLVLVLRPAKPEGARFDL